MDRNWIAALAATGFALALGGCNQTSAQTTLSAEQQALADRIAIEDMVTRYYGNFGKQDAADDFGAFYTEDAVFDVNGIVSTGREAIEAFYTDTGDDEEAPAAQGTFHMMISNPVIDVNGDTASAQFMWTGNGGWYAAEITEINEDGTMLSVLYEDGIREGRASAFCRSR